jgi:hypothetical protein
MYASESHVGASPLMKVDDTIEKSGRKNLLVVSKGSLYPQYLFQPLMFLPRCHLELL